MGLDASVHCNCFKTGQIKSPPPHIELVEIDDAGVVNIITPDDEKYFEFQKWKQTACDHEDMVLINRRLGNASAAGHMTSKIQLAEKSGTLFPILTQKVFYSGTHAADYLLLFDIVELQKEIRWLQLNAARYFQVDDLVNTMLDDLEELCDQAIQVQNPIVF